jgi:hypothetical protein
MDERSLARSWTHVFEEDQGDRMVFRPSDSDIPPSRRPRTAFDLEPDGTLTTYQPGPDDRRLPARGQWRVEGSHLVLESPDAPPQRLAIEEGSNDRLVLRRTD